MPTKPVILTLFFVLITSQLYALPPSAETILQQVDSVLNAPKDVHAIATMTLTDTHGNRSARQMELYQLGSEKRLVRFLAPADQRSISFLSLPEDIKYLYLPAFRKVRRIASHMENQGFAGTDFSYQDLTTEHYAEKYSPTLRETTEKYYILDLKPAPDNANGAYSRLQAWVLKQNYYPEKIEMYNDAGKLWKVLEQKQIVQQNGYWIAKEMQMTDVLADHSTISVMSRIELDGGLDSGIFTRRFLMRVR